MIIGPHRVFPGRLSVSRTIGDIEAKDPRYGGNPKCVIPTPDIKCFKIGTTMISSFLDVMEYLKNLTISNVSMLLGKPQDVISRMIMSWPKM